MAQVDPRYFDWGGRFQEGMEQSRQRRLQDIALGQQQEDRAAEGRERELRMTGLQQQQTAQQQENQYSQQVRELTTLTNAMKALRKVPVERRRQVASGWAQQNPIIAGAMQKVPGDYGFDDQSLDESIIGFESAIQQYGAPQANSDFLRALEIVRNPNASEQEKMAAEVALGLKARAGAPTPSMKDVDIGGRRYVYNPKEGSYTPATLPGDAPRSTDTFAEEDKLRDEVNALGTDFRKVKDAYGRVKAAASTSDAAGDLALIFNFMKMLDPGSVVREGEFATAQNATGVDEQVINLYNRVLRGERLNPQQRREFVQQAEAQYGSATESYKERVQPYRDISKRYGLNIENVDVTGLNAPTTQQPSTPQGSAKPSVSNW